MPEWLIGIPKGFWLVLSEMAPYLLFGFFVAGALSELISARLVERHLGGRGFWPVLKAAAFGVPMPLCSCGVIPVAASLRRHGASRGATTAFLIATPQDGVDSIMVTLSLLGPVFAVFRPIAALVSGLIGGTLVAAGSDNGETRPPAADKARAGRVPEVHSSRLYRLFAYGFGALPRDIGKPLLVGLAIAALISALVPPDLLGPYLGGGIVAMLVMMLLGIPVYVCATASVPIAAALVFKGLSPGAALVFLMTGPATNAATITTVWKVMGRRAALIYLGTVAGTALAAGVALDWLFKLQDIAPAPAMPWMLPAWVKALCAAALLGVLGWALLRPLLRGRAAVEEEPATRAEKLLVKGMTCTHCVGAVRRALLECAGVASAKVDLATGEAAVAGEALDLDEMRSAVEALGYQVQTPPGKAEQ